MVLTILNVFCKFGLHQFKQYWNKACLRDERVCLRCGKKEYLVYNPYWLDKWWEPCGDERTDRSLLF